MSRSRGTMGCSDCSVSPHIMARDDQTCPLGRMFKAGRIFSLVESIKIFKGPTNNRHSLLALLYHMLYVGIFCLIFLLYSLFPNLHESFLLSSCLRLTLVEGGEDGDANVTG